MIKKSFPNEQALHTFCQKLALLIPENFTLSLIGELGAGKTTFCRYLIQALGFEGNIKSPTYTLIETYHPDNRTIFHCDLYRLTTPEELHYLGIENCFTQKAIRLIEWPSKAGNHLPAPDLAVYISVNTDNTRRMQIDAHTTEGKQLLQTLDA